MTMVKIYFLFFLGLFFAPAFANLKNEAVYRKLSSGDSTEKIIVLQSLKQTTDKTLFQKVMEIALLDTNPEVRAAAENTLDTLSIESAMYNGMPKSHLQKLRAGLSSVFPEERRKALQSIKNVENAPPLIQYTIIKEFVLKPADEDTQRELTRIAASDSYLQKWLMYVNMIDRISETVRTATQNILLNIRPSLEFQNETLDIATSDEVPKATQRKAKNILIEIKLDWEIQKKLLLSISHKAPVTAQKTAKDILKQNPYIHLKIEQYLVSIATSDEVPETTQNTVQDILLARNLHPEVQHRLSQILTVPEKISDTARYGVQYILTWNKFISMDIEQSLVDTALSDKTPEAIKDMITEMLSIRELKLNTQQELWNIAVFDQVSPATRNTAKNILMRTALDVEFEKKLLDITTSATAQRRAKQSAKAILTHNRLLHIDTINSMNFSLRCKRAFNKFSL